MMSILLEGALIRDGLDVIASEKKLQVLPLIAIDDPFKKKRSQRHLTQHCPNGISTWSHQSCAWATRAVLLLGVGSGTERLGVDTARARTWIHDAICLSQIGTT